MIRFGAIITAATALAVAACAPTPEDRAEWHQRSVQETLEHANTLRAMNGTTLPPKFSTVVSEAESQQSGIDIVNKVCDHGRAIYITGSYNRTAMVVVPEAPECATPAKP